MMRRTKEKVDGLPPKTVLVGKVAMTPFQRKMYNTFAENAENSDYTTLRQMATNLKNILNDEADSENEFVKAIEEASWTDCSGEFYSDGNKLFSFFRFHHQPKALSLKRL